MKEVAIIDYSMGNLDSVARAVEACSGIPRLVDDPDELGQRNFSHIILPGVGAFPDGAKRLRENAMDEALRRQVFSRGAWFLGLCLGMQLLAAKGWEGGETAGLNWIDSEVRRLEPQEKTEKIPHIGWNEVHFLRSSPLFRNVPSGRDFYFVHSYHMVCGKEENVMATTPYCGGFVSSVSRENVFGFQFHPEKSQRVGLQLLSNFIAL